MDNFIYTNADENFILSVQAENEAASFSPAMVKRYTQLCSAMPTFASYAIGRDKIMDFAFDGIVNSIVTREPLMGIRTIMLGVL